MTKYAKYVGRAAISPVTHTCAALGTCREAQIQQDGWAGEKLPGSLSGAMGPKQKII